MSDPRETQQQDPLTRLIKQQLERREEDQEPWAAHMPAMPEMSPRAAQIAENFLNFLG